MHFVEVDTDILPNIEITTNLNPADTLDISDTIFFNYEITLDTGKIFFTQIYFDDLFLYVSENMSDSISINPFDTLSIGSHDLYMEVVYKSTTGSLADKIDAEFLLKDTVWQVIFSQKEVEE